MRSVPWIVLAVLVLFACTDDDHDQFREDVFDCEDAVAHLYACCPAFFVAPDACHYSYDYDSGCDYSTTTITTPAFNETESRCIGDMSCQALIARGVCDRARGATPRSSSSRHDDVQPQYGASTSPATPRPAVCP